jgi:uncharacterized membrane protein YccC
VPNLANAPELLCLLLAAWVGMCLHVSLLDRTPRSYVSMLAGYTSSDLRALPTLQARSRPPSLVSITVGILCTTLVHQVVFPATSSIVAQRIEAWMQDIRRLAFDSFAGDGENERVRQDRGILRRHPRIAQPLNSSGLRTKGFKK